MNSLSRKAKIWLSGASIAVLAGIIASVLVFMHLRSRNRPLSVTGAAVQQNEDTPSKERRRPSSPMRAIENTAHTEERPAARTGTTG